MRYSISYAIVAMLMSGCSLFGPPLPPSRPTPEILAFEARPGNARTALVRCSSDYGTSNGHAAGVTLEQIADAAIYSCAKQLDEFRSIATIHAKGGPRILGFIDRSKSRADKSVEDAITEAKTAAMDATIRARAGD